MTAENNGTGATPGGGDASQPGTGAEDDPFAYLYRQEGDAQQAPSPGQQPGVPRRSYNQVRAVGERQYGYGYPPQQQRGGYGYPQQGSGSGGYGYPQQAPAPPPQQPSPHYAAPETMAGGRAAARQQAGQGGYGSGRRSRTGLLVGAIAVVAAVVIGIGAAIVFNDGDRAQGNESDGGSGSSEQAGGRPDKGKDDNKDDKKDKPAPSGLPKEDAASLTLAGGTKAAKDIEGAEARGGTYVAGLNNPGASATWDMKNVPAPGQYRLYVRFGVPGKDADATLTVNGKAEGRPLQMKNFSGAEEGDWSKGWQTTWSIVQLKKGENSVKISCESGNQCDANLDKVWLKRN